MGLVKAKGNMYPWVTHCHSHLRGECPHRCPYCYVRAIGKRFGNQAFKGPIRIDIAQLDIGYGEGRTIFVEHTNDLFSFEVERWVIRGVLSHCRAWPNNTYVFQTRNTFRASLWQSDLPQGSMLGTTIETNRKTPGMAPRPEERASGLGMLKRGSPGLVTFVTIEPVLDFDVRGMLRLIETANPSFVNIGADSKGRGLAEPSAAKLRALIAGINEMGIEIRQKRNLERLLGETKESEGEG